MAYVAPPLTWSLNTNKYFNFLALLKSLTIFAEENLSKILTFLKFEIVEAPF